MAPKDFGYYTAFQKTTLICRGLLRCTSTDFYDFGRNAAERENGYANGNFSFVFPLRHMRVNNFPKVVT